MRKFLRNLVADWFAPRWMVFGFDIFVVAVTFALSFLLRFNLEWEEALKAFKLEYFYNVETIFIISFLLFKPYRGILRHSTTKDVLTLIYSLVFGSVALLLSAKIGRTLNWTFLDIPYSVIIIHFTLVSAFLVTSRIIIKTIYYQLKFEKEKQANIMIYGAGELGRITINALNKDNNINVNIVGFIDDNRALHGMRSAGIPIYSEKKAFKKIIPKKKVKEIIIAINKENIRMRRKREIIDNFLCSCLPI